MTCVIRIVGMCNGTPTLHDGKFLARYEPEKWSWAVIETIEDLFSAIDAWLGTTEDPRQALHFESTADAGDCWKQVGKGIRPWDGEPNRPLTAFHVLIERLEEATHAAA